MNTLKYILIKTEEQYYNYCNILEELVIQDSEDLSDEIDLLTLLIEKWDVEHNTFEDLDPVELIKALMEENKLKSKDLVEILSLSKGTISKILNYHKGLSKGTIRKLSRHFKVSQAAFNRTYELVDHGNNQFRKAS